jgi:hypothetical protein
MTVLKDTLTRFLSRADLPESICSLRLEKLQEVLDKVRDEGFLGYAESADEEEAHCSIEATMLRSGHRVNKNTTMSRAAFSKHLCSPSQDMQALPELGMPPMSPFCNTAAEVSLNVDSLFFSLRLL